MLELVCPSFRTGPWSQPLLLYTALVIAVLNGELVDFRIKGVARYHDAARLNHPRGVNAFAKTKV